MLVQPVCGKNRNIFSRKRGGEGGSKAVRKFSGNSSISEKTGFPYWLVPVTKVSGPQQVKVEANDKLPPVAAGIRTNCWGGDKRSMKAFLLRRARFVSQLRNKLLKNLVAQGTLPTARAGVVNKSIYQPKLKILIPIMTINEPDAESIEKNFGRPGEMIPNKILQLAECISSLC